MGFISARGEGLGEYLLVGYPDKTVADKLLLEKRLFCETYQQAVPKENGVHILLAEFWARDMMEPTLIKWIQRICAATASFQVALDGFTSEAGHIGLRVQDSLPFQRLANDLLAVDQFIRASGCPPASLFAQPSIRIAGDCSTAIYRKAVADYAARSFHEQFLLEELQLLHRSNPFDKCRLLHVFRFRPAMTEVA